MKIAVISDIHDNIWNLKKALDILKKEKIKTAFCLGDYCSPPAFQILMNGLRKAYCIWGNVDGEKFLITKYVYENNLKNIKLLGVFGEVKIDKKKIALIHNQEIAYPLAKSNLYDAVFCGHFHTSKVEKIGKTLFANPGEVMGLNGSPSFGIWDSKTNKIEIVKIK